ncbi:MAG: CoA transferase [Alphaproteobacteria bacterium]|nr:CoA transferase [Alphaproteobacteria bacterium]
MGRKTREDGVTVRGALAGIKVVEMGQWVAAPYCTALLADMGADVIKVEKPGVGDDQRHSPPFVGDEGALFMQINRNKRSVVLDLATPEGGALCRQLTQGADVLVSNFRSGTMERLGFAYTALAATNPRLIYCVISGFGLTGSLRHRAGMDLIAQAMSGIALLNASETGQPRIVPLAVADISTGVFAALAILAALLARAQTSQGQVVDLSLIESMLSMMPMQTATYFATGADPLRFGSPGIGNAAPYQIFPTRNGWMAIAAAAQHLWESLCSVLGCTDILADPRFQSNASRIAHNRELAEALNRILVTQDTQHWIERMDQAKIPASPVLALSEILEHGHLLTRGTVWKSPEPAASQRGAVLAPIQFSATPISLKRPAPRLGQDTDKIVAALKAQAPWPADTP